MAGRGQGSVAYQVRRKRRISQTIDLGMKSTGRQAGSRLDDARLSAR